MSNFDRLQPQMILEAVEASGYRTTGEYTQLNSYENRVFDIRLEPFDDSPIDIDRVIAKFYRPERWSHETIQDEHRFLADLKAEGIPAIAPLPQRAGSGPGQTLTNFQGFELALFPRVLGRMPQEFLPGQLRQVGRTLARIHNVGARTRAMNRADLNPYTFGWDTFEKLEEHVYPELWSRYEEAASHILSYLDDELDPSTFIRIHGDCHKGNLLHSGSEFFFVDFDDMLNGPPIQDFWMLLSGSTTEASTLDEQDEIAIGYEELREIPDDWHLVEPLRGLRIISYAAWIAARWSDTSFKRLFPNYTTYNYWLDELNRLDRIASQI